jgi:hypothetical protein
MSKHHYLTAEQEELLCSIIMKRAEAVRPLKRSLICLIASDIRSAALGTPCSLPGKNLWYQFNKKYQSLSLLNMKTPCPKAKVRREEGRESEIVEFYSTLKRLYEIYEYPPERIYCMDETGLAGEAASKEAVCVPAYMKYAVSITGSFREHIVERCRRVLEERGETT